MATATYIFVESEGVRLPDGTVFGNGVSLVYQIMRSENHPDEFTFYSFVGKNRIPVDGLNHGYRECKEWLENEVRHYTENGFKVYETNHLEWGKETYRKELN